MCWRTTDPLRGHTGHRWKVGMTHIPDPWETVCTYEQLSIILAKKKKKTMPHLCGSHLGGHLNYLMLPKIEEASHSVSEEL